MVVKEVHGAGGYGMLVGPRSTRAQIDAFRQRCWRTPAIIAQNTLALSTCPTFVEEGLAHATLTCARLRCTAKR
jgi:uncharacterized circularly permuted ATP-grasp superfamily protein